MEASERYGYHRTEECGSTDCNIPLSMGIPAVCFGVYEGHGAHTREEWVDIESTRDGMKIALPGSAERNAAQRLSPIPSTLQGEQLWNRQIIQTISPIPKRSPRRSRPRPDIFVNRELSWLEFNHRVLSESLNPNIPLMERLKFLSIYFSNLDEFFMVRVGSLHDQSILEPDKLDDKTGLNAAGQIAAIRRKVEAINPIAERAWSSLRQLLSTQDIEVLDIHHMSKIDEQIVQNYFNNEIRPLLSPQLIDRQHPFPFLKNKEQFIVTELTDKEKEKDKEKDKGGEKSKSQDKNKAADKEREENIRIGIVPFSQLPTYYTFNINQRRKIIFTADVILHFVQKLYNKQKVLEKHVMRVTRNADITVDEGTVRL